MNFDPDVQRYIADGIFIRLDLIAWGFTALLISIIVRLIAKPIIDTIHQIELSTVNIIKAIRRKP